MTTGRTGYGRATDIDPLAARMEALEAGLTTVRGYSHFINAKNYDTIQHAIDAAPAYNGTLVTAGSIVFVPAGYYSTTTVPAMGQLTLLDGVTLMGEGSISTVLHMDPAAQKNTDIVKVQGNHSGIMGLSIRGTNTISDSDTQGRGVLFGVAGSGLRHFRMNDVFIEDTGSWGLHCQETSIESTFRDVRINDSKRGGGILVDSACTTMRFFGCEVLNVVGNFLKLSSTTGCGFFGCNWENSVTTDPGGPLVYVSNSVSPTFHGCYWEDSHTGTKQFFIHHEGKVYGAAYDACFFSRNSGAVLRLIKCNGSAGSTTRKCAIRSPFLWLGTTPPTGTDDVHLVNAADEVWVNHSAYFDTDMTAASEVATGGLTLTGAGTLTQTAP